MTKVKRIATIAFGQGANILVNFLFLPYMARVLNYEDYGSYGQAILIVSFGLSILSFGLSQILYVYLAREKDQGRYFDSNLFSVFSIGVLGSIILFFLTSILASWMNNPQLEILLKILLWTIPFQLAYQSMVSRLISEERVRIVTTMSVGFNLLKVLLVVLSIQLYQSVTLVMASILLSTFLQSITGLFILKFKESFKIDLKAAKAQIVEGFPLGLTSLFGTGILYVDGIMVSRLLGVEAFAIYRNGAFEVPFVAAVYTSIAAIILPEVSKLYAKGRFEEIIKLKRKVIMNSVALIYPVLCFLLFNAEDIIIGYLGERYQESAIIFSIFNLTLLIRVNDYHDILMSAKKNRVILFHYLFIFLLNLVLNLILINSLGMKGAAISTVFSLFLFAILLLRRNLKEINGSIAEVLKGLKILVILLLGIVIAFLINQLAQFIGNLFLRLAISAILFFPITYFLLVKQEFLSSSILKKLFQRGS